MNDSFENRSAASRAHQNKVVARLRKAGYHTANVGAENLFSREAHVALLNYKDRRHNAVGAKSLLMWMPDLLVWWDAPADNPLFNDETHAVFLEVKTTVTPDNTWHSWTVEKESAEAAIIWNPFLPTFFIFSTMGVISAETVNEHKIRGGEFRNAGSGTEFVKIGKHYETDFGIVFPPLI